MKWHLPPATPLIQHLAIEVRSHSALSQTNDFGIVARRTSFTPLAGHAGPLVAPVIPTAAAHKGSSEPPSVIQFP